jgi:hypothetical protein
MPCGSSGRPAAVILGIVAREIGPSQARASRGLSHVCEKIEKHIPPVAIVNPSMAAVAANLWVITSGPHPDPRGIRSRSNVGRGGVAMPAGAAQAPAGPSVPASDPIGIRHDFVAALTPIPCLHALAGQKRQSRRSPLGHPSVLLRTRQAWLLGLPLPWSVC